MVFEFRKSSSHTATPLAPARVDEPLAHDYVFSWWHQGVFMFDAGYEWGEGIAYEEATAEGAAFGQSSDSAVTFISPGGAIFDS